MAADPGRDAALLRKRYAAALKVERVNDEGVGVDARSGTPLGLVVVRILALESEDGAGSRRVRLRVALSACSLLHSRAARLGFPSLCGSPGQQQQMRCAGEEASLGPMMYAYSTC